MTHCIICTDPFTDKERAKLKCQYCDFESCKKCCKKYILMENTPKCMNNECDREWTRQFLRENFPQTFLNKDYKTHRENVLFNTERALMPVTQPLVENQIRREKILVETTKIRDQIRDLNMNIYLLNNEYHTLGRRPRNQDPRALFIKACPDPECRGFLSSQWKCGICEKWTCPHCNVIKGLDREAEHECNPDDVSTAALINHDTKSCPSCGTGIFRIEGCDQMWCTQCNTAFSWRTGRIENQRHFHNPHYFEWLRRTGGEGHVAAAPNGNQECRERQLNMMFTRQFNQLLNSPRFMMRMNLEQLNLVKKKVLDYCQNINHLYLVQHPTYFQQTENVQRINEELRIQYMRNLIPEEKFKILIQKQDKKTQKNREISNVLVMVIQTVTDIVHRFYEEMQEAGWVYSLETLEEVDRILDYANECLLDISKTYNSRQLHFTQEAQLR